jgi:putative serine protease PepD
MAGPNSSSALSRQQRSSRAGLLAAVGIGLIVTTAGLVGIGVFDSSSRTHQVTNVAIGPAAESLPEPALSSLAPAVVQITVDRPAGSLIVTGLIIRSDGHVVTASDPLEGARSLTVTNADGRAFNAIVVGTDSADDLAVLHIDSTGLPTPTFGDVSSVSQGDTVFIVSRTERATRSWIASGVFQSKGMRLDANDGSTLHDMIGSTIDALPPTDSAVLCTKAGEVIGLMTSRAAATTRAAVSDAVSSTLLLPSATNSFAHSVTWIRHVADNIIDTGTVHHAWLGVMTTDSTDGGAMIEAVSLDGPAATAGLLAGDRITSLGEGNLPSSSALVVALRKHSANDYVTIGYVRDGVSATTSVKLSDRT